MYAFSSALLVCKGAWSIWPARLGETMEQPDARTPDFKEDPQLGAGGSYGGDESETTDTAKSKFLTSP